MEPDKITSAERRDPHLLIIYPGASFVADLPSVTATFPHLSRQFTGDILAVVKRREWKDLPIGRFELHGLHLSDRLRYMSVIRNVLFAVYVIIIASHRHYRERKYQIVIARDPLASAIVGLAVCALTGAKLVVEVNGNFDAAFRFEDQRVRLRARLRHRAAQLIVPFALRRADAIKLLYDGQIRTPAAGGRTPLIFIFPNFVPISLFHPSADAGKYLLFVGYPWYLKGVDILIRAFQQIYEDFPDFSLKVVGHCPDRTPFERLAAGNHRIEFAKAVVYQELIPLMQNCAIFVLPSRTEAMGRVLIEAMACRKAIVASRVDGIPSLIKHGETGLLFKSEDVDDLAAQLRTLLADPSLRDRIAENAYRYAQASLTEEQYAVNYRRLADRVLGGLA